MRFALLLSAVLLGFSACTGGAPDEAAEETEPSSYEGVGIVKGVKSEGRVVIIAHQDIPGFMEAMTMPFALSDAKLSAGLKPGDTVQFTLSEGAGDWPITKIEKVRD